MGGATGTKNPTRLLPQAGYTESVLEDTYLPTESFVVSDFAQHAFRVGYTPGVEDATLLASSSSSVPLNLSPPPPILTDADLRNHPLKSIRSISTADEPSRKKFMTEQKLRNKHAQVTDKLVNNDQDVALIVAPERPLLQPLLQPPAGSGDRPVRCTRGLFQRGLHLFERRRRLEPPVQMLERA